VYAGYSGSMSGVLCEKLYIYLEELYPCQPDYPCVLAFVFKIIFPLIMTMFGKLEIFFVNGLGLPFHSGTVAAFIIMAAICYFIIRYAGKTKKNIYQTVALSIVYMIIGFSCWMVIPIRANANPPMNLNDPDTAIGMRDYYNREQYGDWPTIYGKIIPPFLIKTE
jgi:hypothetical protein